MEILKTLEGNVSFANNVIQGDTFLTSQTLSGNVECNGARAMQAYDGPYGATPAEQTQTLATNNLRMTADIVIDPIPSQYIITTDANATANDILNTKTAYVNGQKLTGTLKYDWMGKNPYDMGEIYSLSTTLAQTNYNGWTPSTTAASIVASSTLTDKVVMDLISYDYILLWVSDCQVAYKSTWTASKGSPLRMICVAAQAIFRRPASDTAATQRDFNYNAVQQNIYQASWDYYWSSSSAKALAFTTYAPCYISSLTAATFSSTSVDSPTVTIKTPVLSTRCSTTYFTTGNANKVDQTNTTVKMKGHLYRVDVGTSVARQSWIIADDIWNTPL